MNAYLARRLRFSASAELPNLTLPAPFPELLRAWANREINFADTAE